MSDFSEPDNEDFLETACAYLNSLISQDKVVLLDPTYPSTTQVESAYLNGETLELSLSEKANGRGLEKANLLGCLKIVHKLIKENPTLLPNDHVLKLVLEPIKKEIEIYENGIQNALIDNPNDFRKTALDKLLNLAEYKEKE